MEQEKSFIMVTWDFTQKSMFALEHAVQISTALQNEIAIVHIVKSETEIQDAKTKMVAAVSEKFSGPAWNFKYIARHGSIFHTIGEIASEMNALILIMGTHGIQGMQKILGSWALKVVASTKCPVVVVQEPPKEAIFRQIVLPVSFRKEIKECITWAHFFAKKFNTKFIIYRAKYTDKRLHGNVDSNLLFLTKYFSAKGIIYEMVSATGDHDFGNEAVAYAKKIDSDAILIMTTRDLGFADYVLGAHEQYMLANSERIPIICINPKPAKIGGGFSASGG
jgi:nucleotide-binding universal stress UspA family protein